MHTWWRTLHHWCICIGLVPKPGNYQKCQNIRKLPFLKLYPRKQILHCMNISGKGDAGDIKNSSSTRCHISFAKTSHMQKHYVQKHHRWDRRSEEAEVAIYTGQVRRLLSVEGVRSQARCLLDRLRGLGDGAAAAAKRRQWAEREEQRLGRERQAHLLSLSQGYHPLRTGNFLL